MARNASLVCALAALLSSLGGALAGAGGVRGSQEWNYKGFHLGDWPKQGYPLCRGELAGPENPHNEWQSPVDIPAGVKEVDGDALVLTAREGGCKRMQLEHDGHTWEAAFDKAGCSNLVAAWRNRTYTMTQLHFHIESENMLAGHHKDMEVHMVHQSEDGHLLVIGLFLQRSAAVSEGSEFLDQMLNMDFLNDTLREDVLVNPYAGMMQKGDRFYSFLGSLTTPPCTPNLEWIMLETPLDVAPSDISRFESYLHTASQTDSYGHDDRPVQPLNGRPIRVGSIGNIA